MRKICTNSLVVLLSAVITKAAAQKKYSFDQSNKQYKQAYFGFGAGLDYGGFGLKAELLPVKWVGVFGGVGYNLNEPSYNAGISIKILPDKKVQPAVMAMYGYNGVIILKNRNDVTKTYYGATVGAGCDIKYGTNGNKVSLALLVPFRSSEFHSSYNDLKDAGYKFKPDILPVAFSAGLNFAINKKRRKK